MPQFDAHFLSANMFWTTVSFLLLLLLLKKFALPGILEVLEGRRDRIKDDLDAAERMRQEAEALKAEHDAQMQQAKAAANEVIAKAQERATALLSENEERMKADAERIIADANRTIEQERSQAVTELRGLAADLAVSAAQKFVTASLDEETQMRLVDESLVALEGQYRK